MQEDISVDEFLLVRSLKNTCVHTFLNVSSDSSEELEQMTTVIQDENFEFNSSFCDTTVNLTVNSLTHVNRVRIHEDLAPDNLTMAVMQQSMRCNAYVLEKAVSGLVAIILVSLLIVLSTVLIYTNCCHKKSR